jgi:hypothetical protein
MITESGTVGILPPGALGVGIFYRLTRELSAHRQRVFLLERRGSESGAALRAQGAVRIFHEGGVCALPAAEICRPNLLGCLESGWLPEILLVCTQPDQLLTVVAELVELLEKLHAALGLEAALAQLPLLVLCSNGIYHQRVRRYLVELLEESTLYGRLPELWSDPMGRIVAKLLRGVTIQTGLREGHGAGAVYRPGPSGRTTVAGGDPVLRARCVALLQELGGWFEDAGVTPPVRVEFDKALVNLSGNLLGQLKAISDTGAFRPLKVREIFPEPESTETRELATHIIAVGRAVKAYSPAEEFETLYRAAMKIARGPLEHTPSSLQWIDACLRNGTLRPELTPTEAWLLDPIVHYARTAGLSEAEHYFTTLRETIERRLALAISECSRGREPTG